MSSFSLQNIFQLLEDAPFGQVAAAAASDFTNIAADEQAVVGFIAAAVKDLFGGGSPVSAASAAVTAAASSPTATGSATSAKTGVSGLD